MTNRKFRWPTSMRFCTYGCVSKRGYEKSDVATTYEKRYERKRAGTYEKNYEKRYEQITRKGWNTLGLQTLKSIRPLGLPVVQTYERPMKKLWKIQCSGMPDSFGKCVSSKGPLNTTKARYYGMTVLRSGAARYYGITVWHGITVLRYYGITVIP